MTPYLKLANGSTIVFLLATCLHFCTVFGIFGVPPLDRADMFVRLGLIIGTTIGLSFIVVLMIQKKQGDAVLPDEREEKIERYSEAAGVLTIYAGILVLAWFAFTPLTPIGFANGLLAVVAITELVKMLVVLFLHNSAMI